MKISLRYLGQPGYQQGIGQELGVSQATVSRSVDGVVNSIVAQSNEWIKFPTTNHEYINRKGKPTLNVQATCDSREMLTSVDVSWPGSLHDSRIWRNSLDHN
ncbi:unnamed protein product [Acanthoscelides obtectus]|uniref:DDE Tnp4 domain-containing protein n=1 Tax=Acanthoscelides obtectus TaxID=200917 RepID=A0A9P0M1T7_ACAOB|nr:unnamed protein product [Acanthoscelides obtectus]CAH2019188.1 unnamed protein product [Acanthoscelides obtectus]CAK1652619.1 Putative nuclease HARBI1 [Acanthoscelides obtectus]CAK1682658.1 Putative nuclease HARBI1 [Acanthoscelides obtectus]